VTDPLARVREICLALPEVTERLSHGEPTWFIREKKTFVSYSDNHHNDGRVAIVCAAPDGVQSSLVSSDPERFYVPPYVGHRGWLGARVDVDPVPWDLYEQLLEDAYRCVAPKKLVALLDEVG
jgi:hypothetical protein